MLSFLAAVIVRMVQMQIEGISFSPIDVFTNLRNHKSKVFDDFLLNKESVKKANTVYKLIGLKVPHRNSLGQEAV